jgi:hypothetical protein
MRILLLMPSLTGTGGAERMVEGLSRLLSPAGVEAFEASFDSPGCAAGLRIPALIALAVGMVRFRSRL